MKSERQNVITGRTWQNFVGGWRSQICIHASRSLNSSCVINHAVQGTAPCLHSSIQVNYWFKTKHQTRQPAVPGQPSIITVKVFNLDRLELGVHQLAHINKLVIDVLMRL